MGLDERSGHFWLDPLRIAGKETEDLHPLIGSAKGGEKAGVDRTSDTRLGGGMVHCKAACGRLSDKKIKKVGEKAKLRGGNAVSEAIRWATRFLREIKIESRSS